MPYAQSQSARIYYEELGAGPPLVFLHEFSGDHRSWRDQVRYFSRGYRCITMAALGYTPSDVPLDETLYGQERANRDVIAVLDAARVDAAHVVGLSMGAYTTLQLCLHFPDRLRSAVAAGGGSGSNPATREQTIRDARAAADVMEKNGRLDAETMGSGPTRIQLRNKDPLGWRTCVDHLAEHSAIGSARVLRQVQARRPSLYDLESGLSRVRTPVLLMVGDEDEPCLDVNIWMKRRMPTAQLSMLAGSGHVLNYEEPALFNVLVERFLSAVDRGSWKPRDPGAAVSNASSFSRLLNEAKI